MALGFLTPTPPNDCVGKLLVVVVGKQEVKDAEVQFQASWTLLG